MRCADFFIGKPGPGSLSEAVQMGLPVLVTRNAWTMPQERWNTEWVQAQGVGVVRGTTAAAVRTREQEQVQAHARARIEGDEFVQTLISGFDGTIVPDSIQPIGPTGETP
jgi:hypothetical protein